MITGLPGTSSVERVAHFNLFLLELAVPMVPGVVECYAATDKGNSSFSGSMLFSNGPLHVSSQVLLPLPPSFSARLLWVGRRLKLQTFGRYHYSSITLLAVSSKNVWVGAQRKVGQWLTRRDIHYAGGPFA